MRRREAGQGEESQSSKQQGSKGRGWDSAKGSSQLPLCPSLLGEEDTPNLGETKPAAMTSGEAR